MSVWKRDLEAARDRDPAARSLLEIALLYPGVHAIWLHRIAHALWVRRVRFLARVIATVSRRLTGIEIHPGAQLGPGLFIDHGMGVVIGETAEVGTDVMMYHGVTLGGSTLNRGKRHPTIGDRVTIGAGAKILGPIEVGADSRIGANAVVVRPVPPNSVVVGVPGQVISRADGSPHSGSRDLDDRKLPDVVSASLAAMLARVDQLETAVNGRIVHTSARPSSEGVWAGDDFVI